MNIYLICPVRKCGKIKMKKIEKYVREREINGDTVFWPYRDVEQNDPTGLGIIVAERKAIFEADEIHVWWAADKNGKSKSEGSVFDFGMAWMATLLSPMKKIVIANPDDVKAPEHKSYTTVLVALDNLIEARGVIQKRMTEEKLQPLKNPV